MNIKQKMNENLVNNIKELDKGIRNSNFVKNTLSIIRTKDMTSKIFLLHTITFHVKFHCLCIMT